MGGSDRSGAQASALALHNSTGQRSFGSYYSAREWADRGGTAGSSPSPRASEAELGDNRHNDLD